MMTGTRKRTQNETRGNDFPCNAQLSCKFEFLVFQQRIPKET